MVTQGLDGWQEVKRAWLPGHAGRILAAQGRSMLPLAAHQ